MTINEVLNLSFVIAVVIGLTQWIKDKAELTGRPAEVLALLVGAVLGAGYQFVYAAPTDASGWFSVVLVGLAMALVPSGLFKFAAQMLEKVNSAPKS